MKILDCTLRDGGYYNNWDFEPVIVNEYLNAVAQAGVHYVELGLRNFPKQGFLGPFAYTTENYLDQIELPVGPIYGVMVDAKTLLSSSYSLDDAIDKLFVQASESKIGLVRIAAHFHEIEYCGPIAKRLKEKGYLVGFNMMQAGGKSSEVIKEKVNEINAWHCVDALYFADSLGNMDEIEVKRIISIVKEFWGGDIGIHTHNNMGKALDNTVIAMKHGVSWLDVTITGMGRGAGNAQTENLLAYLNTKGESFNTSPIYKLVIKYFEPMQVKMGWGASLLYFLGAQNNIHPTYIQNMLADPHIGSDELVSAIEYLSEIDNTLSYSGDILSSALNKTNTTATFSAISDVLNKFNNKDVLIIANGAGLERHQIGITQYILEKKPIVISLNIIDNIDENIIDYYCLSHNSKYLTQNKTYKGLSKPVIYPSNRFKDIEKELSRNYEHLNCPVQVRDEHYVVSKNVITIPYDLTIAYALGVCELANAKSVALAGFDGYDSNDSRQLEMVKLFQLSEDTLSYPIVAITPTNYLIEKRSVYAPFI